MKGAKKSVLFRCVSGEVLYSFENGKNLSDHSWFLGPDIII